MALSGAAAAASPAPVPVPLRAAVPWLLLGGAVLLSLLYLVGLEQGATALLPGGVLHEFVHDGRHVLGFPCH
jgi:hypothetical protein